MGSQDELRTIFKEILDEREPVRPLTHGLLGDGRGNLWVLNDADNRVWFRKNGQASQLTKVHCWNARAVYDAPVICGYTTEQPTFYQVLSWDREQLEGGWTGMSGVARHGETHIWSDTLGGDDPVMIWTRALMPFRVSPQAAPDLTVQIQGPEVYLWLAGWQEWLGDALVDLTASVPGAGLGLHRYTLIYIDGATSTAMTLDGAAVAAAVPLPPGSWPAPPSGSIPVGLVHLASDQTTITEADIVDGRVIVGSAGGSITPAAHHLIDTTVHDDTDAYGVPVQGDVIRFDTDWERLAKGTAHQLFKMNAGPTLPIWASFDWDEIAAAAAADMVHDHSIAAEGSHIPLTSLVDATRGDIIRRGAADWEAHAAETNHFILVGDGTDIVSKAFDWDDMTAGAGADMVHDHSTAAEGSHIPVASLVDAARGSAIKRGPADWQSFDAKTDGFLLMGQGIDLVSIAFGWNQIAGAIGADMVHDHSAAGEGGEVPLTSLGSYAQGSIMRGEGADWGAYAAETLGAVLIGDGADVVSDTTPTFVGLTTHNAGIAVGTGQDIDPADASGQDLGDATHRWDLYTQEVYFGGATGANVVSILDNLADALHVSSADAIEYLRFITTNGSEAVVVDPGSTGILFGVGTPTPRVILEIYTPAGANPTFYFADGDVAHGMTNIRPTDVSGVVGVQNSTGGGCRFTGLSDTNQTALAFYGYIGTDNPTDTIPAIVIQGYKKNGMDAQALAAAETILGVNNAGGPNLFSLLGGGKVVLDNHADAVYTALDIDCGVTAAQVSEIRFLDRGVAEWNIQKRSDNKFNIREAGIADHFTIIPGGNSGFGTLNPSAKVYIDQSSGTGAKPVLTLDQADVDYVLARVVGTSNAGDADYTLVDAGDFGTPGALLGWMQWEITDTRGGGLGTIDVWVPFYATPT